MGKLIVLDAGHYMNTSGKRCRKEFDPNETREWWLNNRIAVHVEDGLAAYDCRVMRVDDRTGKTEVSLASRVALANGAKADFYISIHHNAGINGGSGGGIVVYAKVGASSTTLRLQRSVYEATVRRTGLMGNRSDKLPLRNFTVIDRTQMPSILGEFGFMDSSTDVPIILTDMFALQCATGIVEAVAEVAALTKVIAAVEVEVEDEEDTEEMVVRYNTVAEIPGWGKDVVRKLIDRKNLQGTGQKYDAEGYPADLDLSHDMLRGLVINDRAGLYR